MPFKLAPAPKAVSNVPGYLHRLLPHVLLALVPAILACVLVGLAFDGEAYIDFFRTHRWEHETLREALYLITDYGNLLLYPVYLALLIVGIQRKDRHLRRLPVLYIVVQLVIAFGLVRFLKITLGRPRPETDGLFELFSTDSAYGALPSGHTTEIVGAVLPLVLWRANWLLSAAGGLLIGAVAFSRIYLGRHHVSDVAFGIALGAYAAALIYCIWTHTPRHERHYSETFLEPDEPLVQDRLLPGGREKDVRRLKPVQPIQRPEGAEKALEAAASRWTRISKAKDGDKRSQSLAEQAEDGA